MAVTPKLITYLILANRHRVKSILSDVSNRVKSLRLRQWVKRRWQSATIQTGLAEPTTRLRVAGLTESETTQHYRYPTHTNLRLIEYGVETTVMLGAVGKSVTDLRRVTERLESIFAAERMKVRKTGPGVAAVQFLHTDPLAEPVSAELLPAARSRTGVVTRIDEDGHGVELDAGLSHLVIGAPGSGKSTDAWALLWALQQTGIPVRLRMFDPKRQEFARLEHAAYEYANDLAKWPLFLSHAVAALQTRQSILGRRGWQKLTRYTDQDPLDLLIVDELLAITKMRSANVDVRGMQMRADDALELLASQGRAAGFAILGLAQLAQKEVLGQVRDLFGYATCLRVPPQAAEMVNVVLGDGAAEYYPAQEIPAGTRSAGVGYTRTESGLIVRTRGGVLTPEQQAQVVERVAEDSRRLREVAKQRKAGAAA